MKKSLLLIVIITASIVANAQTSLAPYNWGLGVKYQPLALSLKHYTVKGDAVEFLLSKYTQGYRATALLELCPKLSKNGLFRAVLGPGLHMGIRDKKYFDNQSKNPVIGADCVMGLELIFPKAHLTFQGDFQPSVDLVGNQEIITDWGGITIRFTW